MALQARMTTCMNIKFAFQLSYSAVSGDSMTLHSIAARHVRTKCRPFPTRPVRSIKSQGQVPQAQTHDP